MTNDTIDELLADGTIPRTAVVTSEVIPPRIAGNLLEFLRRVESKGMEAVAWVEAYQFVQKHAPQPAAPPK